MTIFAEVKGKGSIHTIVSAVSSVLLILWYLLAVSGLDVHTDSEHGRVYVVSSVGGGDCERIHPHAHCHDEVAGEETSHGYDGETSCSSDEDCCSDDFSSVLSLTDRNAGRPDLSAPVFSLPSSLGRPAADVGAYAGSSRTFLICASPPDRKGCLSKLSVLRA